jgi:hypothetical protein
LQLDDEDSIPWLLNLHQENRTMCLWVLSALLYTAENSTMVTLNHSTCIAFHNTPYYVGALVEDESSPFSSLRCSAWVLDLCDFDWKLWMFVTLACLWESSWVVCYTVSLTPQRIAKWAVAVWRHTHNLKGYCTGGAAATIALITRCPCPGLIRECFGRVVKNCTE